MWIKISEDTGLSTNVGQTYYNPDWGDDLTQWTTFKYAIIVKPTTGNGLKGSHNFCRNPGGVKSDIWCYTTDSATEWETCAARPVFTPFTWSTTRNNNNCMVKKMSICQDTADCTVGLRSELVWTPNDSTNSLGPSPLLTITRSTEFEQTVFIKGEIP